MKEMIKLSTQFRTNAETKQVKTARRVGSMRFTKCGTFRGFKYD